MKFTPSGGTEKPEGEQKPDGGQKPQGGQKPEGTEKPDKEENSPQTGDANSLGLFAGLFAASGLGLVFSRRKRRDK